MPFPRFRIRTLMIAVAVVACGTAGEVIRRRRADYQQRAALHANYEQFAIGVPLPPDAKIAAEQRALWLVHARYHAALRAKYERAARRPWIRVPPDPPAPPIPPAAEPPEPPEPQ